MPPPASVKISGQRRLAHVLEHTPNLRQQNAAGRQISGQLMLSKERHFACLRSGLHLTTRDLAQKEQSPDLERMRPCVWMPRPVPHGGELISTHPPTRLLAHFPRDGFGRRLINVRPPARQRPAMLICDLTNQQYLLVAKHSTTHAAFRRG